MVLLGRGAADKIVVVHGEREVIVVVRAPDGPAPGRLDAARFVRVALCGKAHVGGNATTAFSDETTGAEHRDAKDQVGKAVGRGERDGSVGRMERGGETIS